MRVAERSSRRPAALIFGMMLGQAACLSLATPDAATAADAKGKTVMEKVEYRGWKNNLRLANGDVELIVTLDVGPRILSYRLADGKNVFKEYDAQLGKAGESSG